EISTQIVMIPISAKVSDPSHLRRQLKAQSAGYESLLLLINKVLSLAWNAKRLDLIDKMSHAKEQCQKALSHSIGQPKTAFNEAAGLFARIDLALERFYDNPDNAVENAEDDEPALEGLARFSLWYLKDYFELGLLPHIAEPSHLDL